jgi:hypothetical protein
LAKMTSLGGRLAAPVCHLTKYVTKLSNEPFSPQTLVQLSYTNPTPSLGSHTSTLLCLPTLQVSPPATRELQVALNLTWDFPCIHYRFLRKVECSRCISSYKIHLKEQALVVGTKQCKRAQKKEGRPVCLVSLSALFT